MGCQIRHRDGLSTAAPWEHAPDIVSLESCEMPRLERPASMADIGPCVCITDPCLHV